MADPTPIYPADAVVLALSGTFESGTALEYLAKGITPQDSPSLEVRFRRAQQRVYRLLRMVNQLSVWQTGNLAIGIFSGTYVLGGSKKSYAGIATTAVTDAATNYVYLNASNALVINTTGFPASIVDYAPLAVVIAAGGVITSIADARPVLTSPQTTSSSDSGTNNATFVIDEDNAGASPTKVGIKFNRGSDDAEDGELSWAEGNLYFSLFSQNTTETLAKLNLLELLISGTSMVTTDGAAKVQSAVAGDGLDHSAGVLSIKTSTGSGTSISTDIVTVDPSDGIALDGNGVRVAATSNGGLLFTGTAGSQTVGVKTDTLTTDLSGAGAVIVRDAGLAPVKLATYAAANGAIDFIFSATLVGGNTVSIFSSNAPFKFRVVDVWSIAKSADGGTWKIDNGTMAITDIVTVTGTDKTRNACATIDDAVYEIAAAGSLRVVGDGANADAEVYIRCIRVA